MHLLIYYEDVTWCHVQCVYVCVVSVYIHE